MFEGSGSTKQKAKLQAAEMALCEFVQFTDAHEVHRILRQNVPGHSTDFTSDEIVQTASGILFQNERSNSFKSQS